jgi:Ca2+-binding EF-hand superfamily protein
MLSAPTTSLALVALLALAALPQRGGAPAAQQPGDAPARGRAGKEDEDPSATYFKIADYDGDGWIVMKEAQLALGTDRDAFRAYDTDRDGRISLDEFRARYASIIERGGAFPAPVPKDGERKPKLRGEAELLEAFDKDHDGAIDLRELRLLLADEKDSKIAADVLLEKLDRDGSKKLEKNELAALVKLLHPELRDRNAPKAANLIELFGQSQKRELRKDSTPMPPYIPGPVPVFRRLDLDNNGSIDLGDLIGLQRPIALPVQVDALLATLDLDGDGKISKAELTASMASGRR